MTTAILKAKVDSLDFPSVNWKMVCAVGFLASLALLIFYVFQINYLTTGYYLTNTYEKQISRLSDENKNLQVAFAQNSFLGQVQQRAQELNFQKATSVKYVQIPDNSVAVLKK